MSETVWEPQIAEAGKYSGPVLHGRYQVIESSAISKTYVLADLTGKTLVRTTTHKAVGDIVRFDTIPEAEEYATELANQKVDKPIARSTGKVVKENGRKVAARETAASMFRRLILAGDLSDDEIFAQVQKAFNLDDNRRAYVGWYRKDLKKKGLL